MSNQLLPCPDTWGLCLGTDKPMLLSCGSYTDAGYVVKCHCGIRSPRSLSRDGAIDFWNRAIRKSATPSPEPSAERRAQKRDRA